MGFACFCKWCLYICIINHRNRPFAMKLQSIAFANIIDFAASTFDTPEAQAIQDAFTVARTASLYHADPAAELARLGYSLSSYRSVGIWMQIETPTHMLTVLNNRATTEAIGEQRYNLARVYVK